MAQNNPNSESDTNETKTRRRGINVHIHFPIQEMQGLGSRDVYKKCPKKALKEKENIKNKENSEVHRLPLSAFSPGAVEQSGLPAAT